MVLMLIASAPLHDLFAQDRVRLSENSIELNGHRYILHKVNKGETLYSIGRAYNVPSMEISTVNNLVRENIKRGQTLLIPIRGSAANTHSGMTTAQTETVTTTTKPVNTQPQATQADKPTPAAATTTAANLTAATPLEQESKSETEVIIDEHPSATATMSASARAFTPGDPLNVVVFLPISKSPTRNDHNFIDFYKGTLVGLGRLKRSGISVNVKFVSSSESAKLLTDTLSSANPLSTANLIIGPVYPELFEPVAKYATTHGVPIVNPLGGVGNASSPYIFEAAPVEETKYDKALAMLQTPGVNAIVIDHIEWNDPALEQIIESKIKGDHVSMIPYNSDRAKTKQMDAMLAAALDKTRENIIFVPVSRDNAVEEILSRLSSINTMNQYNITVIGTPAWGRFGNINLDMYFRLKVHYPTSYHADRANPAVAAFYKEYIESFGSLPSPYSFRGNDVIRYFAGAMNRFGTNMPQKVKDYNPEILQVQYNFVQDTPTGKHENQNWTLVSYGHDYTIRVK